MSITITLPDGAKRDYAKPVSGLALAQDIAPSLAKKAIAVICNEDMKDLSYEITASADVKILTAQDEEALELLRHDAAHVLAQAVQELYEGVQVTIGPVIEDGFYYDFAREEPFSSEDLGAIEARMHEIVKRDEPIMREVWERDKAVAHFKKLGEHYKAELIASIPAGEEVSIYRQGEWMDLCRGPHLPSTKHLGQGFKLLRVAGAYWRGDSNNEMLHRIYGTAWRDKKELAAWLKQREEAEKRDHRRLGQQMGLFHFQEEAQGMVFWHDKGWTIYRLLVDYMRAKLIKAGYQEVRTPELLDRALWEKSGHWDKFQEHMFVTEVDKRPLALKPMNCPAHVEIFKQGITSYRDLPLRMAEFGSCHRYEPSGALHGLMRVRNFVQDDAHIFCRPEQITQETQAFCALLQEVYADMGFSDISVSFADRPENRVGSDAVWDKAEQALEEAVRSAGLEYTLNKADGAFYGPKIEFNLRDAIGRSWQCGTLQVDFNMPDRLNAHYIDEDSTRQTPVMLHRAILGSVERFIGILLEHYEGKLPFWLAPTQLVIATITDKADAYADQLAQEWRTQGLRVELDKRNEKINYKVREHSLAKVPVICVVGEREAQEQKVSLRTLGSDTQEVLGAQDALRKLLNDSKPPQA